MLDLGKDIITIKASKARRPKPNVVMADGGSACRLLAKRSRGQLIHSSTNVGVAHGLNQPFEEDVNVKETRDVNFDSYSLPQLRALADQVERRICQLNQARVDDARRQIEAIARTVGMPVAELLASAQRKSREGRHRYVNPEDPAQEWTGLGRKPGWVVSWLGAGKPLEGLRA